MPARKRAENATLMAAAEVVGRTLGRAAGRMDALRARHPHPVAEAKDALAAAGRARRKTVARARRRVAKTVKRARKTTRRTTRRVKKAVRRTRKAVVRTRKAVGRARKAVRRTRKAAARGTARFRR